MSLEKQQDSRSKRKRSHVPTSCEHAEEQQSKRGKLERPTSPALSYLSLKTDWSMDLPTNFKGREAFHLDAMTMEKSEASPDFIAKTSSNRVDTEHYTKGNTSILKVDSDRAASPTLSSVSEWTNRVVEQPANFKSEATFHLDPRLLTADHLKCPRCKSMLKNPVSIPCGHNYCRDCINTFWDSCTEDYICLKCARGSKIRPELNTNTALAEVVKNLQQAGFSPALPPRSYAGPEDIGCDFCSEWRLKAVKSCLTCDVFLCETHIRHHYTIPALEKHTLSDVTGAMEKKMSKQNLSADFSRILYGQQNRAELEPVRGHLKSVLNAAKIQDQMSKKALRTSKPKARVTKDNTEVRHLQVMYSNLEQEISGLKKCFSKLSKKKQTKKVKFEDEKDYEEEDDDYSEDYSDASGDEEEDDSQEYGSDEEEEDDEESKKDNYDDEEDYDKYTNDGFDEEDSRDEENSSDDNDKGTNEEDSGDEEYSSDDYDKDTNDGFDEEDSRDEENSSDDNDKGTNEEDSGDEEYSSDDYDKDTNEGSDEEESSDDNSFEEHSSDDDNDYI